MGSRKKRKDDEVAALASAMAEEAMIVWRVMSWTKNEAVPVFGAPTKCPECGAFGLVIKVDNRVGTARNRCTECSLEFILSERAIDAVAAGRMPMPPGIMLPGHAARARRDAERETERAPVFIEAEVYEPPLPDAATTYQAYPTYQPAQAEELPAPAPQPQPVAYPPAAQRPQPEPVAYPPAAQRPQPEPVAYPPAAQRPQPEPVAYPPAAAHLEQYPAAQPAPYTQATHELYAPPAQQSPAAAAAPPPVVQPRVESADFPPAGTQASQHPDHPPARPQPYPAAYPPAAAYPAGVVPPPDPTRAPIEYPPAQPIPYPPADPIPYPPADPAAYPPAAQQPVTPTYPPAAQPIAYPPTDQPPIVYPPPAGAQYPPVEQAPAAAAAPAPADDVAPAPADDVAPPAGAGGPPSSSGPARPGAAPRANRHGASRHHRHQVASTTDEPGEPVALDADLAPQPGDPLLRRDATPIAEDPLLAPRRIEARAEPTPDPTPAAAPAASPAPAALEPRREPAAKHTPEPVGQTSDTAEAEAPPAAGNDKPVFPLAPRVSLLNQPPSVPAREVEPPEPAAPEPLPTLPERGNERVAEVVRSQADVAAPPAKPAATKSGSSLFSAPKPAQDQPPTPGNGTGTRQRPLRVLLVEDDPTDAAVVEALLAAAGPDVIDLRVASTRERGQAVADEEQPDIVLLDLDLPDSHGLATITRWIFAGLPGRVIVMSGDYSPELVERGKEQGVAEFVHKRHLMQLLQLGDEGTTEAVRLLNEIADAPMPSTAHR